MQCTVTGILVEIMMAGIQTAGRVTTRRRVTIMMLIKAAALLVVCQTNEILATPALMK
jgi:hypothetical protein